MILFFYGEETYRPTQKIHELTQRFLKKNPSGSGLVVFDCDEKCDISGIMSALGAQNLFAQNQLIIIKNILKHTRAPEQNNMIKWMTSETPDVVVFVENGAPRKNAPLYKWLIAHGHTVFESTVLTGSDLEKWITKQIALRDGKIDTAAARELILFLGSDLWRLSMEIDKLSAFAFKRIITVEDVHTVVHGRIDADIFATVGAMIAGNPSRALTQLRKQVTAGDDVFRIFGMLAYHIRTLLIVQSAVYTYGTASHSVIAKETSLHPFVVQKSLLAIQHTSLQKIKKMHTMLTKMDHDVKTGKRDIGSALDLFVMHI